jgi:hypothetical protein
MRADGAEARRTKLCEAVWSFQVRKVPNCFAMESFYTHLCTIVLLRNELQTYLCRRHISHFSISGKKLQNFTSFKRTAGALGLPFT